MQHFATSDFYEYVIPTVAIFVLRYVFGQTTLSLIDFCDEGSYRCFAGFCPFLCGVRG
jgi:hypothetical protein